MLDANPRLFDVHRASGVGAGLAETARPSKRWTTWSFPESD